MHMQNENVFSFAAFFFFFNLKGSVKVIFKDRRLHTSGSMITKTGTQKLQGETL